jgi:hypothetical protein
MNEFINGLSTQVVVLIIVIVCVVAFIGLMYYSAKKSLIQCPHCKRLFKTLEGHWCDESIKHIYLSQLKSIYDNTSTFQCISFNYGCENCGNKFTYKIFIPRSIVPPTNRTRVVQYCDKCTKNSNQVIA